MPRIRAIMSADKVNTMVVDFHNQMIMMRLVNSGTSYNSAKRNRFTQKVFDSAYAILAYAFSVKDIDLFNRIYAETKELVAGPYITPEMQTIRNDFYGKTSDFVAGIAVYLANKSRVH